MSRYKRISVNGESRPEHIVIWENEFGPVPAGYVIHHNREEHRTEYLQKSREYWYKNRDSMLLKKKLYNDAHREERNLKEKIRCAIKSGKPQEKIDDLKRQLELVIGGNSTCQK